MKSTKSKRYNHQSYDIKAARITFASHSQTFYLAVCLF